VGHAHPDFFPGWALAHPAPPVPAPMWQVYYASAVAPRVGSWVVRIDPLRFLAGCRTRRVNQALSVLSLSL